MSKRSPNSVADDKMTDTPREERLTLSRQLLRRLKVLMRKSNETNGGLTLGLSEVGITYEVLLSHFLVFYQQNRTVKVRRQRKTPRLILLVRLDNIRDNHRDVTSP